MARTRSAGRGRGRVQRERLVEEIPPPPDPLQLILQRLDQQQKSMEDMSARQARQEQERDTAIATAVTAAVAAAMANLRQPDQEAAAEEQAEDELEVVAPRGLEPVVPEPVQPQGQVVPEIDPEDMQRWMSRFCNYHPPAFEGAFDIQAAEDWVNRLEKIFKILRCPSEIKAQMAIYKLEKDADQWWRNTELIMQLRDTPITWELFLEQFYEKYFPQSIKNEKEAEFLALKQGDNESFDDYLSNFIHLSRYSSYLRQGDNKKWRADKLIRGLKKDICDKLLPKQFKQFNKAAEVCRITKYNMNSGMKP